MGKRERVKHHMPVLEKEQKKKKKLIWNVEFPLQFSILKIEY